VTDDEFVRRRLKRSMANILAITSHTWNVGRRAVMRTEKFKSERESRKRARA